MLTDDVHEQLNIAVLHFKRNGIANHAGTEIHEIIQDFQSIRFQRVARFNNIDDDIRQTDNRCQFDRAIEFDNIYTVMIGFKITARNPRVLSTDRNSDRKRHV